MNPSPRPLVGIRVLVTIAATFVVIAGLKAAKSILIPFVFAFFLAILGAAPLAFLNKRLPKYIAVLVVTGMVIGAFTIVGALMAGSVNEFTNNIPLYQFRLNEIAQEARLWLEAKGLKGSAALLSSSLEPARLMDAISVLLRNLVSALSSTLLVFVFMIFMLIEAAEFREKLRAVLAVLEGPFNLSRFADMSGDVQRYLAMKTVTSGVTGLLVGSFVAIMGLDFAILWGMVAFLLNYIPFVGSIVAAIPAVLLAIVQIGFGAAASIAAGYFVINIGISNFFEPILMGRRLGISPLVVFLSLIFWGWVWGPAGMLLSVPLTMVVKILLEHSKEFRWIAILMDSRPGNLALDPPSSAPVSDAEGS